VYRYRYREPINNQKRGANIEERTRYIKSGKECGDHFAKEEGKLLCQAW
jgi:hypothetical protein